MKVLTTVDLKLNPQIVGKWLDESSSEEFIRALKEFWGRHNDWKKDFDIAEFTQWISAVLMEDTS